jgi:hypothetical protein
MQAAQVMRSLNSRQAELVMFMGKVKLSLCLIKYHAMKMYSLLS